MYVIAFELQNYTFLFEKVTFSVLKVKNSLEMKSEELQETKSGE